MKRVLLSRDNEANVNGLLGSAFRDPESGKVVLVYVNMQNAPVRLLLNWRGDEKRKVDRLTPFVTSENPEDNLRPYPSVPATGPIEIPPRSVVTLVGEPLRDAGS
jgi:hypothetical protein